MKKFSVKKLENVNTMDLVLEFKNVVNNILKDIEIVSPKIEELFSDQAFSENHKLVASFKNLEPAVKSNKNVNDQIYSWLIQQMNTMSKTIKGMQKTVEHVEKHS